MPFKTLNKNTHIKAFHRSLEDKCLSKYEFKSYAEVSKAVSKYIKFCNKVKIYGSLGYTSSADFYHRTLKEIAKSLTVKL